MSWTTRVISSLEAVKLGSSTAALSFEAAQENELGAPAIALQAVGPGPRRLRLNDADAFDLSFWCGTCPLIFERLEGANEKVSSDKLQKLLNAGVESISADLLDAVSAVVPPATYIPTLLLARPKLVSPGNNDDYFTHEQVAHRGVDAFWGLPHHPKTQYYRTGSGRTDEHHKLFEFLVPMVPPTWNDRARVLRYEGEIQSGSMPTVLALSILDMTQPFDSLELHGGLIHFVLDGHHKLEAAARLGAPISVLSLLSVDDSLAGDAEVAVMPMLIESLRSQS